MLAPILSPADPQISYRPGSRRRASPSADVAEDPCDAPRRPLEAAVGLPRITIGVTQPTACRQSSPVVRVQPEALQFVQRIGRIKVGADPDGHDPDVFAGDDLDLRRQREVQLDVAHGQFDQPRRDHGVIVLTDTGEPAVADPERGQLRLPGAREAQRLGIAARHHRRYHAGGGSVRVFGSHRIRHATATLLVNNGMPLEEVSRYLGHSSTDVTRRYAQQTTEALGQRAAAALVQAGLVSG